MTTAGTAGHRAWLNRAKPYLIFIGVGMVLGTYRAASLAPAADEQGTLFMCAQPFGRMWPLLVAHGGIFHVTIGSMPLGYYLLVKSLFGLFGNHLIIARLISAVGHVVTVCVVYRIFERARLWQTGAAVAGLILIHPALVWHACDARVYSLLFALQAISVLFLLSPRFEKRIWVWILVTGVTPFLHYYATILVAFEVLFVWVYRPAARRYLFVMALLMVPVALFIYRASLAAPGGSAQVWPPIQIPSMIKETLARLGGAFPADPTLPVPVEVPLVLGAAIIIFCTVVTLVYRTRVLLWLGAVPYVYVPAIAITHWVQNNFYHARYVETALLCSLAWMVMSLREAARGRLLYPVCVGFGLVLLYISTGLPRFGATCIGRPTTPEQVRFIHSLPGPIVIHPGRLASAFLYPAPTGDRKRYLLSAGEKDVPFINEWLSWWGTSYPPTMTWDAFRARFIGDQPFTVIISRFPTRWGSPPWFCEDYDRAQVPRQFIVERLWRNHPFLICLKYTPRAKGRGRTRASPANPPASSEPTSARS